MLHALKSSATAKIALITLLAISFISVGCSNACNPATAEIESLKPMVSNITVGYEDGTTIELTPDSAHFDEVCDEALRIALSINSQCRCVSNLQTVEQLSETNQAFIYVFFSQSVDITTCISVDEEGQEYITTSEDGYRIISTTVMVILPNESLPEIWASCNETEDLGIICGCWGSARSVNTINDLINDLR
ncbi:MAG: hypothetical protein WC562_06380 [Dehalococcoidia bacterium]